ncbi:hypothetical protein [Sphingomonas sp. SUN039]|uniref:hypothetical protein n=1 Tax=Sphingomonas sp. SUN039 TaxID=2937787 RepID=UPI00216409A2|nr:hypothetical protein [Sphingomonas sp. SUN039]UVO55684.1 hypothetical protein M0209_16775 [Sphingomonas sp. SUN039]
MADRSAADNPFSVRTVAIIVLGGVLAFLGFLFLMAYAPQIRARGDSGAQPMSKSAVGFYGLYKLSEATGRLTELGTDEAHWSATGFVIVTIQPDTDLERLKRLVAARRAVDGTKTLYILPKYLTLPSFTRSGWVQNMGMLDPEWSKELLAVFGRIAFAEEKSPKGNRIIGVADEEMAGIDIPAPSATLHYIAKGMKPVLIDSGGEVVMGRTDLNNGAADYILADPDILSNQGLKSPEGARAALAVVDALRHDTKDSVAFDMVLNASGSRNLLQLMFEPPFLALTLAVLAAALLVGIHAFGRFGPAVPEPRAIPFGKRALADNAAVLIARAGAVKRLGDRYVAMIRETAATALGAGALDPEAQERWLAGLPSLPGADFATLAARTRAAPNSDAMRSAARALHDWRNEVVRDR